MELDLPLLFATLHRHRVAPSGTSGYADLHHDAVDATLFDVAVEIASLADVVRSKQAANRPKDQRVLPTLRRLLADRGD